MPDTSFRRRFGGARGCRPLVRAAFELAVVATLVSAPRVAHAAWPATNANLPVCIMTGAQNYRGAVSDGAGGMFITWSDARYVVTDIYVQHVRADGTLQWQASGLNVCAAASRQEQPVLALDGTGGVYVVWKDYRVDASGDVYAQYIRFDGVPMWTYNGIAVAKGAGQQGDPVVIADGTTDGVKPSGLIVAWQDERNDPQVLVQRLDADGNALWNPDGVPITSSPGPKFEPAIVSDGGEGAIVAWSEQSANGYDVHAQHVDADGALQWGDAGVLVSGAPGHQVHPVLVPDGLFGAWFAWQDYRGGVPAAYVQHCLEDGSALLALDGDRVCPTSGDQTWVSVCADTAGGAFVTWQDARSANDVYAQRLDVTGHAQWAANGVAVCAGGGAHVYPSAAADGTGGLIVAWEDGRNGSTDIYSQKLDAAGALQWALGGDLVSNAAGNQYLPVVVSSGDGHAIVAWEDARTGTPDLYAQRVAVGSSPNVQREDPNLLSSAPNPAREAATFAFDLPSSGRGELAIYDATGRHVRTVTKTDFSVGDHRVPWDARDDAGRRCADGVYFARLTIDGRVMGTRRLALMR